MLSDAILHGIKEGFIDETRFDDPYRPRYEEVDYFVEAVTGRSRAVFREVTDWLSDEAQAQTMDWALDRLNWQGNHGQYRALISHSPDFIVRAYGRGLGVEHSHGSYFHTKEGVFSGRTSLRDKARAMTNHVRVRQLGGIAFAAGDSLYDVPMLLKAQHGVLVNPSTDLQALAHQNNWEVITV